MSINDPIILRYDEKKDWYYLTRGRETFYTESRIMRVWPHEEDAIHWSEEELGKTPIKEGSVFDV